ncbi:hypothetical protein [Pelosinus sp. sgz500959]|uniref:hypothetical protein n=1 Tax=Pelosinus sp. sgz500959 TaxID=3242472 RepID=UPI00366FA6CF
MLAVFSLISGSILLSLMFFMLLFASLGFVVGMPITTVTIWLSLVCTLVYGFMVTKFYFKQETWQLFAKLCLLITLSFLSFMYISGLFYDISYDGQVYHQEAVGQLAHGWNPFQDYLTKDRSHSAVLLNHYAKGPWIYEAVLYSATGQIEQSKVFNFLLIIISFLLTLSSMKQCHRFSVKQAVIFSLLMALNPISIYQALSFYIDGQLASLLLCLVALSYRLITQYDRVIVCSFIMSIALTVNIKFTGVVYVIACVGLAGGWLWLLKKKHLYANLAKTSIIGLFIGICVIGYNPYVTNIVYYGHPFYPLYGAGPKTMDIMTSNSPQGFMQMNSLEKLYVASFSMSTNNFDREEPVLKIPFTVRPQEFKPFVYGADIRIGGFGPWFSGMLLLAGLTLLLILIFPTKDGLYGIGLVVSIMISVLINPESWWARYVPQFWLMPISIAAVAATEAKKVIRYLGVTLTGAVIINLALITYPYILGNYYCTQSLDHQLQEIAKRGETIQVCFGDFTSNYARFAKWGIDYVDARDDIADINIEEIRYKYLTAVFQEPLLSDIFVDERMDKHE